MARALIVGCGCRGRELGRALLSDGWSVRGTSRRRAGLSEIEGAGIEAAPADPMRLASLTDLFGDVAVVVWPLGSVEGDEGEALNGDRLESLLAHLVDTPVRGVVIEVPGRDPGRTLELAERARATWRIPIRTLHAGPTDHDAWVSEARDAVAGVLAPLSG